MTQGTTREVLDGIAVGGLPALRPLTPTGSQITVTERDGTQITTFTWSACLGVSTFLRGLLGEPAATASIEIRE